MNWIIWLLLGLGIAFAGVYFFLPSRLVALLIWLLRKWSRISEKSVDVEGINWPYLEGGPEGSELIVLLHGFGGDKDNWTLYARYLTKQFRVIAPDLPGFGNNVRNPDWHYGAVAQTGRLHAFLNALGVDKCHLAGNSMGGYIALNYALTHPDQLESLTMMDNAGVASTHKSELELAVENGKNPLVVTTLEDYDRLLKFVTHKRIPAPKFMMRAMLQIHLQHYDLLNQIFWTIANEALRDSLTKRLGEVSVPSLIIWGRHDRLIDVSCTEVMTKAIPDNKVIIFEDVGHVPMIESPRETAAQHIDWIAGLEMHAASD